MEPRSLRARRPAAGDEGRARFLRRRANQRDANRVRDQATARWALRNKEPGGPLRQRVITKKSVPGGIHSICPCPRDGGL